MEKVKIKVLVVNVPLEHTKLTASLENYKREGYDVFILPSTEEKMETEVVLFNKSMVSIVEQLFIIETLHNNGDPIYCFDSKESDLREFYKILRKKFKVTSLNLTDVEG